MPVPVSKPRVWPLNSLADRPTCSGQPVTVRCESTEGTAVLYSWYREGDLLHRSSDLQLHCGIVIQNSHFYCLAMNKVNSQQSDIISVQVLMPADSSCIYVITIQGENLLEFFILKLISLGFLQILAYSFTICKTYK